MEVSWRTLSERRRRETRQLEARPLCAWCLQQGQIAVATVAVPPLSSRCEAQSLCGACHARQRASSRMGYVDDIGLDGYPVDPRHPFNRPRPPTR